MTDITARLAEALREVRADVASLPHSFGMEFTSIRKIDAALAAYESERVGWQPIETAPKDGRRILIALANGKVTICRWTESDALPPCRETHWQPLPGAPVQP